MEAPHLGFAKPGIGSATVNSCDGSSGSFYGVQKEWDGVVVSPPKTWDVQLEDLEPLAPLFPLEKTHREITEEPSVIAARISNALQALSIQAEFCKKAVKAKCQTNDCVSFRIRMYAGSDIGVPVIVEIQRRSGSPTSFMRTCRVLLDAASQGNLPTNACPQAVAHHPLPADLTSVMPCFSLVQNMKCLANVPDRNKAASVADSLALAVRLLSEQDSKTDNAILALESILCLTDPLKSSSKTVLEASESVLFNPEMRDRVFEHALSSYKLEVDACSDGTKALIGRKRQLAYAVFANAIESMSGSGRSSMTMDDSDHTKWFSTRLVPAIVAALHDSPVATCVAYQASRCATLLAAHSEALRNGLRVHRSILVQAHEFGRSRHELLREQVWTCLELLN
jgi:hypothetical protein